MTAVELRGVYMMGRAYLCMAHVVLYSGFARSFSTCSNHVICVFFAHTNTHTKQCAYYVPLIPVIGGNEGRPQCLQ